MRRIVGGVRLVDVERGRIDELVRLGRDPDVDAEAVQAGHDLAIEPGDRHRLERQDERRAVAVADDQLVIDEVEPDLERAPADVDRASW